MPYGPHTADDREHMLQDARPRHRSTSCSRTSRSSFARRRSTCRRPSPSSSSPLGCEASPRGTGPTSCRSSARASTATGARRPWTRSCSVASGTRPTRRTSRRSARGRSRASTSTSRSSAELVDLDVVSASHYDGAAATAEAALMTCRATRRDRVLVSRGVHPHYRQTLQTYFSGGLVLDEIPLVDRG